MSGLVDETGAKIPPEEAGGLLCPPSEKQAELDRMKAIASENMANRLLEAGSTRWDKFESGDHTIAYDALELRPEGVCLGLMVRTTEPVLTARRIIAFADIALANEDPIKLARQEMINEFEDLLKQIDQESKPEDGEDAPPPGLARIAHFTGSKEKK